MSLNKIQNIGVQKELSSDLKKRIRLLNNFAIIAALMAVCILGYALIAWPSKAIICILVLSTIIPITLLFNAQHQYKIAQNYFFISTYAVILALVYFFGTQLHFQYFLVIIVGLPVLVYKTEHNKRSVLISAIALLLWALIEWQNTLFSGVFYTNQTHTEVIRICNDILIFATLFIISYLWILINNIYVFNLVKTKKNLAVRTEELAQFSLLSSHQLKSPLTTIEGLTDLLIDEATDNFTPDQLEYLKEIKNTVQTAKDVLDSVVNYTTLDISFKDTKAFSGKQIIEQVAALIKTRDAFDLKVDSDIPTITGGISPFKIIFFNLIDNAVRYNPLLYKKVKISYNQIDKDYIKFTIEDNGPGIPENYRVKMFKLFETFQVTESENNKGLGLAIVRKLVLEVDGEIGVERSNLLGGTLISFTWPLSLAMVTQKKFI